MWVSGIFGMAISFAENTLSVCYREKTELGTIQGGPMLYLQKGVKSRFLAGFFALFCLASAFGLGNLVQAHTLSEAMYELFQVPHHITGILLAVAIGIVLVGGVKRVGKVATICVPVMGALYCASGLSIILFYWKGIPQAFWYILHAAFSPEAAIGGLVGAFFSTVRVGMARGIFSNEAGLGSAPIASAEAQVPSPAYQGVISMSGTFLSTCIVCTVTAFVIVLTGAIGENPGLTGATLTIVAFQKKLMFGGVVVGLSLFLFGYSTSLGWAYYGERALSFLLGAKAIIPFRFIFCGLLVVGSISSLETVWLYADIANGLMAYPNLIALLFLAREVKRELTHYLA
jgi:AGCS family alanine or glycine:cation symporter